MTSPSGYSTDTTHVELCEIVSDWLMYSGFIDWQIHDIEKGRADYGVWGQSPQPGRWRSPSWALGAKFAGK